MNKLKKHVSLFPATTKPADPARLAIAYRQVRLAPPDPDARLALATELMRAKRFDLVRRHLRRSVDFAPPDWPGGVKAGNLLFRVGDAVGATDAYRAASTHAANDGRALWALAAIQHKFGDRSIAQQLLVHGARVRPVNRPREHDPEKPTILRLRSVDGNKMRMRRNPETGLCTRQLTGGHFSVNDLFDRKNFNLYIANLTAGTMPDTTSIPSIDIVINAIGCPDKNPAGLRQAAALIDSLPSLPVINHPANVLRTTRAENARRLNSLPGVTFPRTKCVEYDGPPQETAFRIEALGLGYPLILRIPGTQTGETVELVHDRDGVAAYLSAHEADRSVYAIEYVDCRGPEGFYHKTRAFFLGGQIYPVANLTSNTWEIHSANRDRVMMDHKWMREREMAYLKDPRAWLGVDNFNGLNAIGDMIGLDFLGIDFTVLPSGRLIVFEANAAMRHNFDYATAFPYTRPHLERISAAFEKMLMERVQSPLN